MVLRAGPALQDNGIHIHSIHRASTVPVFDTEGARARRLS